MTESTPAGWYPDPENPGQQRYWDGTVWTEHSAPGAPVTPVAGPATVQEKKPFYKRTWFIVLAVIVGLAVIGNMVSGGGDAPVASSEPSAQSALAETETEAEPASNPEPVAAPEPEPEPKWVEVIALKGNANKRSETFKLTSDEVQLEYSVKGSEMPVFAVYVMDKGESLEESGGIPEVMVSEAGSDKTMLVKQSGEYYLDVKAANCDWTVTVREKR